MKKSKLIAIIVVVVAIAGAYLLFSRGGLKFLNLESLNFKSSNPEDQRNASAPLGSSSAADMSETYTSPDYGFSFKYPKGFNTSELDDDSGHTVLVQNAEEKKGFQVYITLFDEPEPLTAARILQDLPASEVIDPKDVLIGEGKAINAVIFLSTNPSFGKTREIWFVHPVRSQSPEATAGQQADQTSNGASDGNLYQVTAYEGQDNLIGPILETLHFEN